MHGQVPESFRRQVVLELLPEDGFAITGQPVPDAHLETTLAEIFAGRPTKLLFVKAAPDRRYAEVVAAMGRSKGAGVQVVALMPR